MKKKSAAAFTLLEMLLVITISTFVVTTVFQTLRFFFNAWDSSYSESSAKQSMYNSLTLLREEITTAYKISAQQGLNNDIVVNNGKPVRYRLAKYPSQGSFYLSRSTGTDGSNAPSRGMVLVDGLTGPPASKLVYDPSSNTIQITLSKTINGQLFSVTDIVFLNSIQKGPE